MPISNSLEELSPLIAADDREGIAAWMARHDGEWLAYLESFQGDEQRTQAAVGPFEPSELRAAREFYEMLLLPEGERDGLTRNQIADRLSEVLAPDGGLYRRLGYCIAQVRRYEAGLA